MPSRMEYNAISHRLISYVVNSKKGYRRSSDISDEDFLILIIYAIAYIEECELNHDNCTANDVRDFLDIVCRDNDIKVDINELASDIMMDCFQNSGKGYVFESKIVGSHSDVKILEDHTIDGTSNKRGYKLTPSCRKWLYASYEMEAIGQITLSSLVLQKQIEAGNFEKAKDSAKKLLLDIRNRIKELEKLERNIISDVDKYTQEEIDQKLKEPYETSNDTDEKLKYLDGVIAEVLDGNYEKLKKLDKNEYVLDCFSTVKDLQEKIKKIIIQNQALLRQVNKMRNTYQEQLLNSDYLLPKKYVNFEKEVLEVMKQNPTTEFDLHELLSPLFGIKRITHIDPNNVIRKQTIMVLDDEESIETNLEEDVIVTELEEEQDFAHAIYIEIIEQMLSAFKKINTVRLSEIVGKMPLINDNLPAFKMVITMLMAKGAIKFTKFTRKQNLINVFALEDIEQFNKETQDLVSSKVLTMTFDESKFSIYGKTEGSTREKFVLNDIIFVLNEEVK